MNAHQRGRRILAKITRRENNRFFRLRWTHAGKTENTKLSEARRKISLGYFVKF